MALKCVIFSNYIVTKLYNSVNKSFQDAKLNAATNSTGGKKGIKKKKFLILCSAFKKERKKNFNF